jgi:hypothetical protein
MLLSSSSMIVDDIDRLGPFRRPSENDAPLLCKSGTQAGTVFIGNVATENDDGIFVDDSASGVVMKGSISYANGSGLSGGGLNLTVEKCSFIGNEEDGIITNSSSSGMVISKTNIFGNDDGDSNCGFRNQAPTAPTISKSFWGAAEESPVPVSVFRRYEVVTVAGTQSSVGRLMPIVRAPN